MTQTAPTVQLTLESMLAKFRDGHPYLIEPFEALRPQLEAGTGAEALTDLIKCSVSMTTEQGFFVYTWTGQNNPFELSVPRPFDPHPQHPQHSGEMQQQAQVQEAEAAPEAAQEDAEPVADPSEPAADTAPAAEEAAKAAEPGMFTALAELIGDSTLLMTVACTGKQGDEQSLTVTVIPQGEETFEPVCLTGTAGELDTHFVSALSARAESKKTLAEQIEALKAADKALEEAKKQEADAKTKQAEAKKKAAAKKEEQVQAEETKVEEKAEAEKQQDALF